MKKSFLIILAVAAMLFVAACSGNKVNPLWGLWTQKPVFGPKTEFMFNDDNTGFVFVADTVQYETMWSQDSLLRVNFYETSSPRTLAPDVFKSFRVTIDGDKMKLEEVKTGKVTQYSRYVE